MGVCALILLCSCGGAPDLWYAYLHGRPAGVSLDSQGRGAIVATTADTVLVRHLAASGEAIWENQTEPGKAAVVAVDGGAVYVGGSSGNEALLLAYDEHDGTLLWRWQWAQAAGPDDIRGIAIDGARVFVSGATFDPSGNQDALLLALTPNRQVNWFVSFSGDDARDGTDIFTSQLVQRGDTLWVGGKLDTDLDGGDAVLAAFAAATGATQHVIRWPSAMNAVALAGGDTLYCTSQEANAKLKLQRFNDQGQALDSQSRSGRSAKVATDAQGQAWLVTRSHDDKAISRWVEQADQIVWQSGDGPRDLAVGDRAGYVLSSGAPLLQDTPGSLLMRFDPTQMRIAPPGW